MVGFRVLRVLVGTYINILLRARALLLCLGVWREAHPLGLLWLTARVRSCFPVAYPLCTGAGSAGIGGIRAYLSKKLKIRPKTKKDPGFGALYF